MHDIDIRAACERASSALRVWRVRRRGLLYSLSQRVATSRSCVCARVFRATAFAKRDALARHRDHERARVYGCRRPCASARGAVLAGWRAGKLSACRAHEGRTTLREHSDPWRLPWQMPSKWTSRLQLLSNPHGLAARRWPPGTVGGPASARGALRAPRAPSGPLPPPPPASWGSLGS